MKKLILTLLLGGLMMTGLSAKTAFVYFSATGTTERMAKMQQKQWEPTFLKFSRFTNTPTQT